MSRPLSHEQARAFYDRFGARQDWQRIYEGRAVAALLDRCALAAAHRVVEFGCGTGALARELLRSRLPPDATYLGLDVSATMVRLAAARVAPWAERAAIRRTGGECTLAVPDAFCDRLLSVYVLDLLDPEDIRTLLREARRALAPGGLLGLASLTFGQSAVSRAVAAAWQKLFEIRPALLGGCRPLRLAPYLGEQAWAIRHREVVSAFGLCTEVVVAAR